MQAVGGGLSGLAAQFSDESALEVCIHVMRYTNRRLYFYFTFYCDEFVAISTLVIRGRQYKLTKHFCLTIAVALSFYRAMHVVLARYCYRRSSVCPSVRPSVRDVDVP